MIKADKGTVHIEGTEATLLSDLSCVARMFKEKFGEDVAEGAFRLGLADDDELAKLEQEAKMFFLRRAMLGDVFAKKILEEMNEK